MKASRLPEPSQHFKRQPKVHKLKGADKFISDFEYRWRENANRIMERIVANHYSPKMPEYKDMQSNSIRTMKGNGNV